MRNFILAAIACAVFSGSAISAVAQNYPDRPVRVEVGYVPGPTGPDQGVPS